MKLVCMVGTLLLTVTALAACGAVPEDAAPKPAQCAADEKVACRVAFRGLAEDSSRFDGHAVRVEGYLGVSRGLFVLSSSKELFDAGATDEVALRLRGPVDVQERIFDQFAYSWVAVTGTFRITPRNGTTDDLLLGEIHAPLEVRPLRLPVPVQRETFGDVILDLQDIK